LGKGAIMTLRLATAAVVAVLFMIAGLVVG
jgi:hypothetical protein